MVKQFIKSHEEEDLSDLEIDNQEGIDESEANLINEEEALINHQKKIQEDFHKLMKSKEVSWLETMDLISDSPVDKNLNVDDDIRRELIFYNLTLQNAVRGIIKLKEHGEKLNRPGDFFAEMIKGDNQMEKIKKQIVSEQQRIKKFEEKKNKIQNVKFAKAMKDSQNKSKAEFKRKTKEGVEAWKQHIKNKPNDYQDIDKFFDGKNKNQGKGGRNFNRGDRDNSGGSRFQKGGRGNRDSRGGREGRFQRGGRGDRDSRGGRGGRFQKGDRGDFNRKNRHDGKTNRPGKVKRMIQRNKKNSRNNK